MTTLISSPNRVKHANTTPSGPETAYKAKPKAKPKPSRKSPNKPAKRRGNTKKCSQGEISHRAQMFVTHYLLTGNSTQSAIKAGYSQRTAAPQGSRLLRNVNVCNAIEEGRERIREASFMSIVERKKRLSTIARASVADFQTTLPDGETAVELTRDTKHHEAVAELSETINTSGEGGGQMVRKRLKLHDPLKAIDLLNKMDGLYEEQARPSNNVMVVFNIKDSHGNPVNLCDTRSIRAQ